jgi:hypothetical protein
LPFYEEHSAEVEHIPYRQRQRVLWAGAKTPFRAVPGHQSDAASPHRSPV